MSEYGFVTLRSLNLIKKKSTLLKRLDTVIESKNTGVRGRHFTKNS